MKMVLFWQLVVAFVLIVSAVMLLGVMQTLAIVFGIVFGMAMLAALDII